MEQQGVFPLALARVQLRLDPWDLALLMQEVLALRGDAQGNPEPGCAWTGDINGIWQLRPATHDSSRDSHDSVLPSTCSAARRSKWADSQRSTRAASCDRIAFTSVIY